MAKKNQEERKVTKVDSNTFDVEQTTVVSERVDKKALKKQIEEMEGMIAKIRKDTGLEGLEKDLAEKQALLAELK